MTNTKYTKLTAGLIAAWFTFSLVASAFHVFRNDPSRPPLAVLLAVLTPITLFSWWYLSSKPFREFALALNPQVLTLVQAWRIAGFTFLALYSYHILPAVFALPAGWGDIAIGATAPLVAFKLANSSHRKSFILWQLLGMTDLALAITSGAFAASISAQEVLGPNGITTAPMTALPLSVIPTFAVPLLGILHIISIAQARRWRERQYTVAAEAVGSIAR